MSELKLKTKVAIKVSGEEGEIIGIAQYVDLPNQFFISYKSADGRAVKDWYLASELKAI
ncbi:MULTISPECIES: hypothetical protein [Gilliamella]|uniref:hypothetical protein n=1 Tax=Gilliamella TaxID=1193503 RepID=UPI001302AED7|nr:MULTISPECIES: hypothetical protein [Gilliamella]